MELIQNIPVSVRFLLEGYGKDKANKKSYTLYARIIFGRQKSLVSLKMSVKEEDWDFENEQFYSTKNFNIVRNNKLHEVRDKIAACYLD